MLYDHPVNIFVACCFKCRLDVVFITILFSMDCPSTQFFDDGVIACCIAIFNLETLYNSICINEMIVILIIATSIFEATVRF